MVTKGQLLGFGGCIFCLAFVLFLGLYSRDNVLRRVCVSEKVHENAAKSTLTTVIYRNISSTDIQFKKKGIVYDCLSQRTMRTYDADDIMKNSKPIQTTLNAGEDPRARKSSFIKIFNEQTWGGRESGVYDKMSENYKASGPGSDIHRTIGCMALLHTIIEKLKIHLKKDVISFGDIPCGDLQWMSYFLNTRSDVKYTGIDIVPALIERHKKKYRNNPNVNFINADVVQSPLNVSFDFIFSRQMMQHFKNSDINRVLKHISDSGTKYMIATTYTDLKYNTELYSTNSYRFRQMNLELPPYNLVPPICSYQEPESKVDYLALWELPLWTQQS